MWHQAASLLAFTFTSVSLRWIFVRCSILPPCMHHILLNSLFWWYWGANPTSTDAGSCDSFCTWLGTFPIQSYPFSEIKLTKSCSFRLLSPAVLHPTASLFRVQRAPRCLGIGSSVLSGTGLANFFSTLAKDDGASTAQDIAAIQEEFRANPESAKIELQSTSQLTSGLRHHSWKFELASDEPFKFGGTNTAPSPVQVMLASLGTSQEITYKAHAQVMSIPRQSVSLDIRGAFCSVDSTVRSGIQTRALPLWQPPQRLQPNSYNNSSKL